MIGTPIDKLLEVIRQGDSATYKLYIGETAILTYSTLLGVEDAPPTLHYTLRDRLGSVVSVVDDSNTVIEHRSYDPFGKPRQGSLVSSSPATLSDLIGGTPVTQRGFTDHEHLDDAQLIHMNGRVYDYNLGRFLSVDPFIQAPGNSQSLNPYSYIMNNPLAGTDPSGYLSCSAEQTVGECGLEAGGTADIVDSDGNSLGTATLSEDGETLTTSGNNGVNATITGKVSNGVVFTLELQNKQDIGSQSHAAKGSAELPLGEGGTNQSGEQQDGRSERQIKADEFVEEKYGEILRVGEIDLSENIRQASEMGLSDFLKWKGKVTTFGDWDYKNNEKLLRSGLFTTEQLDEFGNFHFGVIAAAYGFSLNASVTGAGANQAFRQGGGNKLEAVVSLVSGAFSPVRATQVRR